MAKRQSDRRRFEGAAAPVRAASQRPRRVAEQLRHVITEILRGDACRDPILRDSSITVTEVRIGNDLRNATLYVMPLAGANAAEIVAALRRSTPFLRGLAARELGLRYAPALTFALDDTFDRADRISALLALPEVERDLNGPQSAAGETNEDAG
jgi:ribosome-binding factor A